MKAVTITDFGGPEKLEFLDAPPPASPKGSEILVRVKAAGLNRADILQRRGLYPAPDGVSQRIPGLEFAGEVVEVGSSANQFALGDRVMGITAGEAQAELLLVDEKLGVPFPATLSWAQAAAIPEVYITAHDAIVTQGQISKGEWLLIHAVGSGVGLAALQIAKLNGAFVIGTSRTADKLDRAVKLGLDRPLETADGAQFAASVTEITEGSGADVILDLVGAGYFAENLKAIANKGRVLVIGLTSGRVAEIDLGVVLSKRVKVIGSALRSRSLDEKAEAVASFERDLMPFINEGKLTAEVDKIFPANEVAEAHRYMESNANFGKIILEF
ncbi:MAG: NAD(P)H-quinone oxidoreductase [Blastocatellia bacterium]|nr:NAD(P)H-quinone oxidoreductase [Blastocatellia bacterium]